MRTKIYVVTKPRSPMIAMYVSQNIASNGYVWLLTFKRLLRKEACSDPC